MTTAASRLPDRVGAILFDMDNTLVESEHVWFDVIRQMWLEAGGDPEGKGVLGGTVQDVVDAYVADFPDAATDDLCDTFTARLAENLAAGVRPTSGAQELVTRLSATLPITIASNSPSLIVRQVVTALGWDDVFTAALGTEDVDHPKPAPDLYVTAAQRCGVTPERCVIFEDSPMGAQAARAAGAFVVTVGPEAADAGDLNVTDLTDPLIISWYPEVDA